MPRVPRTTPDVSEEQLEALLAAPDKRTWVGIRDRAILLVRLDTLIRVSELVGLDAKDIERWAMSQAAPLSRLKGQ
jgi:site-specific recombinase XerD